MRDAARAIDFYARVFGAREDFRLSEPGGKVGHAELLIGDSRLMLADEYPDFGALSPASVGGTPVTLHLYVADVDATVALAEEQGATVLRAPKDEFYGDRSAQIARPLRPPLDDRDARRAGVARRDAAPLDGDAGGRMMG